MHREHLENEITQRRRERSGPIVVGISGYAGAGKSTLARRLAATSCGWRRLRGDDFLDPRRSHRRSTDWDGVEREHLVQEVLVPFRAHRSGMFRRYDWTAGALGEPEPIPRAEVLIVDLIGLFHPETMPHLDLALWRDVPLTTAQARGMRRDAELGRDHAQLWTDVWVPNERDFDARYDPRRRADLLVSDALASDGMNLP